MPRERTARVLLLAGIVVLYLSLLSTVGIFDPEEGRHVSIATAMLRTHDWVIPQLQGFPYLEKPPLAYWLVAAAFSAFGRSELAARLPTALMGLAGIAATFVVAKRVFGTAPAIASAAVLALTTQWFVQARYMTTDMIVSGWITIALAAFYVAFHTRRRGGYVVFWIAMAMAALAKGLIGIVLPCGVVAAFILVTRRFDVLARMRPLVGAVIVAAIVVPWFVLAQRRVPEFLHYFVIDQHVARFLGQAGEHPAPFWFFVPVVLFGFFPWIVHLPAARRIPGRPEATVFLWSWFVVIFGFFSAAGEKLMGYVLAAYPPLAILVGVYLAGLWSPDQRLESVRSVGRAAIVSGVVLLLGAPVFLFGLRRFMAADGRLALSEIGVWPWVMALVLTCVGAGQIVLALMRRPRRTIVLSAAGQLLAFFVLIEGAAAADGWLGTRPIGAALSADAGPEDAVVLYRVPQPSVEYYLGRPPLLFGWTGEHAWGMSVRPDPALATDDPAELSKLLSSSKTVWLIARAEDHRVETDIDVPLEKVMGNRKRTVYRNHPVEAR